MRFRTLFLVFLLAELVSYAAYFFPALNTVGFFVLIAASLVLSLRRLEYGLCFVLAELIFGGKSGLLFSLEYAGFVLSLRMALFIVVISVWISRLKLQDLRLRNWRNAGPLKWWGVLGVAVVWGIGVGLLRGNDFGNLFLDVNGYFYGALILPFMWCIRQNTPDDASGVLRKFTRVFFVATTLLALKTLLAVYLFTHAGNNFIAANLLPFYRWVRDTGVGEITTLPGNFARVFFQSQIYSVVAFFGILAWFIISPTFLYLKGGKLAWWILLILNTSVIIVSLSRSFWVGTIVGLIVLGALAWHSRIRMVGTLLLAVVVATGLLFVVARFPFPKPSLTDLSTATQSRLKAGAAGQSRWNLLPPLFNAASKHTLVGHGFGKTITYISDDPRIREVSRTGEYTTYAFEWGWLDIWLKMGVLGLVGFAGIIIQLARALYHRLSGSAYALASLAGLASLAAIHFFTPYLNHPLGFGLLIFFTLTANLAKPKPM